MKMCRRWTFSAFFAGFLACLTANAQTNISAAGEDMRYGPFNLFDHRTAYGQGIFPEPFLLDDSDLEDNEARFDWLHSENPDGQSDAIKAELEKGIGLVTLELEVPFERDRTLDPDTGEHSILQAFDNISIGARCPLFQYVSPDGVFDTTTGAAIEFGIPVNSSLSKNAEIVPKIFDDLRIGRHFTLQTVEGYSMLLGTQPDGNLNTFEYGVIFGWAIHQDELPLPGVHELIPIFELRGDTELNKDTAGHNSLRGNVGFRANLSNIGPIQPRLGIGYVFPIDKGARDDFHWGVFTSLVLEF
jgi:hypothetical protein